MSFQESTKPAASGLSESAAVYGHDTIWDDGDTVWDNDETRWDWILGGSLLVESQKPATGGFQES